MNDIIDDLYRTQLIDLANDAKNMTPILYPLHEVTRYNAACGDEVKVQIQISAGKLVEVVARTKGCIICAASASIMCHTVKNQSTKRARVTSKNATKIIADGRNRTNANAELDLLSTVSQFPNRVRCAILAWEALDEALRMDQ